MSTINNQAGVIDQARKAVNDAENRAKNENPDQDLKREVLNAELGGEFDGTTHKAAGQGTAYQKAQAVLRQTVLSALRNEPGTKHSSTTEVLNIFAGANSAHKNDKNGQGGGPDIVTILTINDSGESGEVRFNLSPDETEALRQLIYQMLAIGVPAEESFRYMPKVSNRVFAKFLKRQKAGTPVMPVIASKAEASGISIVESREFWRKPNDFQPTQPWFLTFSDPGVLTTLHLKLNT